MPAGPPLFETVGQVLGLAGVSWLTFNVVSFLEVKKKGDALVAAQQAERAASQAGKAPPPPRKPARGFGKGGAPK